jgi:penicillin-binding protein 1A
MQRRRRRREQPLRFEFVPPPPPPGRPTEARRRRIRWFRLSLVLGLLVLLGVVSAFFGFMTAVAQENPHLDQYTAKEPPQVGFIYARDPAHPGKWEQIGVLRQGESRLVLKPEQISTEMKNAIVAIEDRRFYEHKGFDPAGIVRAAFKRIVLGSNEGGSTITQQLIKNRYLTPEQTIRRKFQEISLAYQLERSWKSKPKILAAYLNTIYFGHGCYGVAAAARFYYDKPASRLDIAESAMLAAIPKSPDAYDPLKKPAATLERRNLVIDAMVAQGFIDAAVGAREKARPLMGRAISHEITFGATRVPYFVGYVTAQLIRRYGEKVALNGGLKVYTTIDLEQQRLAEKTVADHLKGLGPDGSLVSIEPSTGTVKAMVGGPRYDRDHEFNIATDGHRQPGSSFKPFVLIAALQRGIQPATQFTSRKVILQIDRDRWMLVRNDTPDYVGPIDLATAMTRSDNTVYAQLTQTVHPTHVVESAHAMGINSPLDPNLSIGLGGLRVGVTPLEMAHAYSTLANRGKRVGGSLLFHTPAAGYTAANQDPISIERVEFPTGRVDRNAASTTRAIPEVDALSALDTMRGVTTQAGTGTAAALPGRTVIGKTGTTSDFKDAWFVGMTPQLVTAVWVGYADVPRSMKHEYHGKEVFGGTIPAEIWHDFTRSALKGRPSLDWPRSAGRGQDAYVVDTRKEPYERSTIGCKGARELVLAVADAPASTQGGCNAHLAIVPLLTGLKRTAARSLANYQGLKFQYQLVAARPGQTLNRVVEQVPDAGIQVALGEPVRVFIAVDVPLVHVPDVASHGARVVLVTDAIARLRAMGFKVVIDDGRSSSAFPDGAVIGQSLAPGDPAARGSVVTIAVVGGVPATTVPVFEGMTLAEARRVLGKEGLRVTAIRASGGRAREGDLIVDADIGEGDRVPDGSTIAVQTAKPVTG